MYAELMSHSTLLAMPLVALVLFMFVFAGVVVRTYGRRAKEYDSLAALPLGTEDGDE